jgi:hypothetical protein
MFKVKVKVKVKLSLCFNWAPRHEVILGERRYSSTHSLTSALDGGEWSVSRPGRFTPREIATGVHSIGGWVGPRVGLDTVSKRKILSPYRESNPGTPILQPVAKFMKVNLCRAAASHISRILNQIEVLTYIYVFVCVWLYRPSHGPVSHRKSYKDLY